MDNYLTLIDPLLVGVQRPRHSIGSSTNVQMYVCTTLNLSDSLLFSRVVEFEAGVYWVMYLAAAGKYLRLLCRPLEDQKGMDERTVMAS